MIQLATSREDLQHCFPVIAELRNHLSIEQFLNLVEGMFDEGYQLAYLSDNGEIVCCAGFRITDNLFLGKNLYIDDIVTAEKDRSKGHGKTMLNWLVDLAKEKGCTSIHLDSGVHRASAHKFYLNQDFKIVCYHFLRELDAT